MSALLAAAVATTGCAGGDPAVPTHDPTGAFDMLAPCEPPPPAVDADVAGLRLPPQAVVTGVTPLGPLTQADGFVGLNPVEVRRHYESREDVEILSIEDEGFESEVLLTDGRQRMYLRAQVVCATGSSFTATVGPQAAAGRIPTPQGVST